jgi:hypothetical protein
MDSIKSEKKSKRSTEDIKSITNEHKSQKGNGVTDIIKKADEEEARKRKDEETASDYSDSDEEEDTAEDVSEDASGSDIDEDEEGDDEYETIDLTENPMYQVLSTFFEDEDGNNICYQMKRIADSLESFQAMMKYFVESQSRCEQMMRESQQASSGSSKHHHHSEKEERKEKEERREKEKEKKRRD